jgi:hypothetical protein
MFLVLNHTLGYKEYLDNLLKNNMYIFWCSLFEPMNYQHNARNYLFGSDHKTSLPLKQLCICLVLDSLEYRISGFVRR